MRTHPTSRIKVLVVDDRLLLAEMFRFGLSADRAFDLIGTQTEIRDLHTEVRRLAPDVIVLDYVMLLRGDGSDIVRSVGAEFSNVRVLVVTQSQDEETILTCVRAGAAGYITKNQPLADLHRSIRCVHAGDTLFAAGPLANLLRTKSPTPPKAPTSEPPLLGARECEVLQLLATGLSPEDTAASLSISVQTVRTHLKNIMRKLDVHSRLEAVIVAMKKGLIAGLR